MEDKQEKSYPSGKIMFYSMDEHTLPCHILTSPLPALWSGKPIDVAPARSPSIPSGSCCSRVGPFHTR